MTKVDRSRHLEYLRCPRARYLGYHHAGVGLTTESSRPSIYLITGGAIHKGLEGLLSGQSTDDAVAMAQAEFDTATAGITSLEGLRPEHLSFTIAEQRFLVDVLVRVYARRGLPALLAEYEVVSTEQEYEWPLTPGITFMSRLDVLIRHKDTGDLVVVSFKSDTGRDPLGKLEDHAQDLQGITEPWALWASPTGQNKTGAIPTGVKMEFLVKGQWKEDKARPGFREQDTFLVHPWKKLGSTPTTPDELRWSYYWECTDAHQTISSNGRKTQCPGGKTHGLGQGWEKCNAWEIFTAAEWVDTLAEGHVQSDAGDALASVLFLPPVLTRTPEEMESRLRQVAEIENRIVRDLRDTQRSVEFTPLFKVLDETFPQNTATCNHNYGGKCQFHAMCWPFGTLPRALDNYEQYGYTKRSPNHPGELEGVSQK